MNSTAVWQEIKLELTNLPNYLQYETHSTQIHLVLNLILLTSVVFLLWPGRKSDDKNKKYKGNYVSYSGEPSAIEKSRRNNSRQKTYDQGYPDGWYTIMKSSELAKGQVKYVECLGLSFAVFREEETGKVRILDSHCPHLGANLAIGGRVVGDSVECPFHKWTFRGSDGVCQSIPYCASIPTVAKVQSWIAEEYHNLICIYYSSDEERRSNPIWNIKDDEIQEINDKKFVYQGTKNFTVNMHIQEFAENSVDFQHFDPLHGQMTFPFTEIPIPGVTIRHVADWVPSAEKKYIANFYDKACLLFRGKPIPRTSVDASITFLGPGGIVIFRFVTGIGNIILFQTHTPTEGLELDVQFHWYAENGLPKILTSYVVNNWITQWKRDVMVWENKIYLPKPALAKNDGPVMKLRRWYSQFYPSSSSDW